MSETAHSDEELLRRRLHELAESEGSSGGPPVVGALVARGRRALWRRRAAAVTASVALFGVVGAGGVYGGMFDSRGDGNLAARKDDTGRTLSILRKLLPEGEVSQEREDMRGSLGSYLGGALVFDDGKGAAAISITLGRTDSPLASMASLAGCSVGDNGTGRWGPNGTCTTDKFEDGSDLLLAQGHEPPYRDKDTKFWSARLIKPDGSMLTVTAWNAPSQKGAEPTRENPPLTQQQLSDVVSAKEWRTTLDSFPRRGGGVEDQDAPTGFEIVDTLESLLPSSLKPFGSTGGTSPTDFVSLGVKDGKGEAQIEVNVDHRGTNESDQIRIEEQQGPYPWSDKGTLRWSVTAVRPGGFRVVVTAYNAGYAFGEPTRATAPLTMKQLRAIATSDAWDGLK
ncbi:hypothetical protein [Streptomyces sp. NPDC020681]|uniref:hypothetical protein n=1 Tax=Streptomyces sp. NPDC020681 TaxID=3365083 RepID=UPI0037902157